MAKITVGKKGTLALAIEIADDEAISAIQSCGIQILSKSGALLWYEIDPNDELDGWYLARAVRYLDMRGKLRRRNSNPNHVKAVI